MTILAQYTNGNCAVTLHDDGTKTREWPDGETAKPEFPESVDLKITNRCDKGCAWCHERAAFDGKHAPPVRLGQVVEGLPGGVEIAIGGGNPMSHPCLLGILQVFHARDLISNMTVQAEHAMQEADKLQNLQACGYLHGVGISDPEWCSLLDTNEMFPANVVCHAIVGIDNPFDVMALRTRGLNVLVLGYKRHGRGEVHYNDKVATNIERWRYFTGAILRKRSGILSFDNLALEQLDIRNRIPEDVWADHYMGDDGAFTMYYDAVRNEYAASSVSERRDAGEMTLKEMFQNLLDTPASAG